MALLKDERMTVSGKFWQLAEQFVAKVHDESRCPVIVCDDQGCITCSSDRVRIGHHHAGAKRIMSGEVDEVFVTAREALDNDLIKEGYNCVIQADNKRIGTFGIAGTLEIVKPLARISAMVMTSWIHELEQSELIEETSGKVFSSVDDLTIRNRDVAGKVKAIFQNMEQAAGKATKNVKLTDDILKSIQDISSKSAILSLNGTIEAARAGESGRAFAVVADEMRQMSKSTKEAATTIEENLKMVTQSIVNLNKTVTTFSGISTEQFAIMDETIDRITLLKETMQELNKV
jgi:hypothetical protein